VGIDARRGRRAPGPAARPATLDPARPGRDRDEVPGEAAGPPLPGRRGPGRRPGPISRPPADARPTARPGAPSGALVVPQPGRGGIATHGGGDARRQRLPCAGLEMGRRRAQPGQRREADRPRPGGAAGGADEGCAGAGGGEGGGATRGPLRGHPRTGPARDGRRPADPGPEAPPQPDPRGGVGRARPPGLRLALALASVSTRMHRAGRPGAGGRVLRRGERRPGDRVGVGPGGDVARGPIAGVRRAGARLAGVHVQAPSRGRRPAVEGRPGGRFPRHDLLGRREAGPFGPGRARRQVPGDAGEPRAACRGDRRDRRLPPPRRGSPRGARGAARRVGTGPRRSPDVRAGRPRRRRRRVHRRRRPDSRAEDGGASPIPTRV
jgi:hypothetical protein